MLCLHTLYADDIREAPGIKGVLNLRTQTPLHYICCGQIDGCTVMVSQAYGSGKRKVIITAFGSDEKVVGKVVDDLLMQMGAVEDDVPKQALKRQIATAKMLVRAGLAPEWLGNLK